MLRNLCYQEGCSRPPDTPDGHCLCLCGPGAGLGGLSDADDDLMVRGPLRHMHKALGSVSSQRLMNRPVGGFTRCPLNFLHRYNQPGKNVKSCNRENQQPTNSPSPSQTTPPATTLIVFLYPQTYTHGMTEHHGVKPPSALWAGTVRAAASVHNSQHCFLPISPCKLSDLFQ